MKKILFISLYLLVQTCLMAQEDSTALIKKDTFDFMGQLSATAGISQPKQPIFNAGIRYIPEVYYGRLYKKSRMIDFDLSTNIGATHLSNEQFSESEFSLDLYRAWARYSADQVEVRLGLQKINFGSSTLFRPLRWFDQVDLTDPLRITNGVYGLLGRYYFINNANIWLWGLYGNEDPKGSETMPTSQDQPEYGARVQVPTKKGEIALTYHHRAARGYEEDADHRYKEHKIGLDGKWDLIVGCWLEASHVYYEYSPSPLRNSTTISPGLDYTFGLGNGLNVVAEHLLQYNYAKLTTINAKNTFQATAVNMNYPIGLNDQLSYIAFYDWKTNKITNNINWQHSFLKWSLYVIANLNPNSNPAIVSMDGLQNYNSGLGLQVMAVFKH